MKKSKKEVRLFVCIISILVLLCNNIIVFAHAENEQKNETNTLNLSISDSKDLTTKQNKYSIPKEVIDYTKNLMEKYPTADVSIICPTTSTSKSMSSH